MEGLAGRADGSSSRPRALDAEDSSAPGQGPRTAARSRCVPSCDPAQVIRTKLSVVLGRTFVGVICIDEVMLLQSWLFGMPRLLSVDEAAKPTSTPGIHML